jgi:V8-like Glu-specific endopeptidase
MLKFLVLATSLVSFSAFAVKQAPAVNPLIARSSFLKSNAAIDFEGIVKLSGCSGSLVAFKGAPKTNKAIVMTNGHCLPVTGPNQVIINKPTKPNAYVGLFDANKKLNKLPLSRVIYATMDDTDVTFYEATMTYAEIEKQFNTEAFVLNDELVRLGTEIEVVSGYWEISTICEAEAIAPILREDVYVWKNAIRYSSKCMTKGGYSGSPVVEKNTRTVVGLHNTGNNGKLDCSDMNPCEQNESGVLIFREVNRRYAQQVYQFYSCLDDNYEIDVKVAGCLAPKPKSKN